MIQDIVHIQKKSHTPRAVGNKSVFQQRVGLLQYPELGYILFDTGYAGHFKEATKNSLLCICKTDACSFYGRAIY